MAVGEGIGVHVGSGEGNATPITLAMAVGIGPTGDPISGVVVAVWVGKGRSLIEVCGTPVGSGRTGGKTAAFDGAGSNW